MPSNHAVLVHSARTVLRMNNRQLAEHLGVALRTVNRWNARQSHPYSHHYQQLARSTSPLDRRLAAEFAAAAGTTLEALGLEHPAKRLAGSTESPPDPRAKLEAVLFAAAEAADLSPRVARTAIAAAIGRAQELGITLDALASQLAPAKKK